jgi:hypothetical protein
MVLCIETNRYAAYKRLGDRLAEGITIGCSSLSAIVAADEQISAFVFTFGFGFSIG